MTLEEAEKAMVMAYSNKKTGKIGEFGLGMKTASSNLGSRFEVVTTTTDSAMALRFTYDEDDFIASGAWALDLEEIPKSFDHGTMITITKPKVNIYGGVKDTVLKRFGKIFKHFVSSGGVEIIVNSDQVVPEVPDTIKDFDTEIKFEVGGKLVRGWAGLLTKASPKGGYGFDLVRHSRVMIQHEKLGFSAQAGLAYLVGELHLDDFPVVNNKMAFRTDTYEWNEMVKRLNEEFLVDLKRESRARANPGRFGPKEEAQVAEIIDDVKEALKDDELQQDLDRHAIDAALTDELVEGPVPFSVPSDGSQTSDGSNEPTDRDAAQPSETEPEMSLVEQHRHKRAKTQLANMNIEHILASLGREGLYKIWDVEGVATKKRLVVTTNRDHPMYAAMEDSVMLWVKHNIVESAAEFYTSSTGLTDKMLAIKSDILKQISRVHLRMMDEPTYVSSDSEEETTA
jgi:hypothetical protein